MRILHQIRNSQSLFLIVSQVNMVHSDHSISLRPILLLTTYWCTSIPCDLFPSSVPSQTPLVVFRTCYMPCPPGVSWFDHPNIIWWSVQIMQLFVMQFSPASHQFCPLRLQYLPQCPVFKHPQSMFLPQCDRPGFTPIHEKWLAE